MPKSQLRLAVTLENKPYDTPEPIVLQECVPLGLPAVLVHNDRLSAITLSDFRGMSLESKQGP